MTDFYMQMKARLECVRDTAKTGAYYCGTDEVEGCVVYEHLLNLESNIRNVIKFYATNVPTCDRGAIVRMVRDREVVR